MINVRKYRILVLRYQGQKTYMEGGDDMAVWCVWLAVFVVCIGLEAASMALTSIWFAGGALIACVLSIAGVNLYIQMAVFVVVSFLLLYSTRPLALRYINQKTVRTNVDALVGKKATRREGRRWCPARNGRHARRMEAGFRGIRWYRFRRSAVSS